MNLSKRLKQLRKEKNIKQKDLALYLDVSSSTIGKYEMGKREPNIDKLNKIADYFNVSVDYLIGRTNKKSPYSIKKYFNEDLDMLKKELELSEKQIKGIKESQLQDFIMDNFDKEIPNLGQLKEKLDKDDNFQLEDYTDKELKNFLEKSYKSSEKNNFDIINNDGYLKKQIQDSIKEGNKINALHKIPLYNEINYPEIKKNEIKSYINAPTFEIQNKNYFYLKVNDNSMINTGIENGDTILIRKQNEIKNGNVGLVWINEEKKAVIRTINNINQNNDIILQPQNPKFDLKVYKENTFKIIGEVIEIRKAI